MTPPFRVKDPAATKPYGFDWTTFLDRLGTGITVTASAWTVTGPDEALTLAHPSIVTGGKKTQVYLAGGTLGRRYVVTNRVTTSASPTVVDERSLQVFIQNQ